MDSLEIGKDEREDVYILTLNSLKKGKCLDTAGAVDYGCAKVVVFLFGDPEPRGRRKGCEDRASDPNGVLALRWGDNFNHRVPGRS